MTKTNKKPNKSKRLIILLIVLAVLLVLCVVCYIPVSSYLAGRRTPLDESAYSTDSAVDNTASITNEEIDKLISGEVTLDELLDALTNVGSGEATASTAESISSATASSESLATSDAASSDSTASSSSAVSSSSSASISASSSHQSGNAASSSTAQSASYEAELKSLISQLYSVQARANSGINSAVASAKAEYHALPADQRTQAKKIAICFSKAGQLSALQASCDKEVNSIVSQMRTLLSENGQSTALADEVMSTYKSQKSAKYNELISKLYS